MKAFNYYQPTEIIYGVDRLEELGKFASRFGEKCLLATTPPIPVLKPLFERTKKILTDANIEVVHFDQVQSNPTIDNIAEGAKLAKKHKIDFVVGLGGGSSIDTAKAIAVETTHEGSCWDYLYFRETQPTKKTLPIIAISTTSGTGSQVTQVAVVTNSRERNKSALYHSNLFPKIAIVDPKLMLTLPEHVTASTGFDAFCHAFESTLHPNSSPYTDTLAYRAIQLIAETLPDLLKNQGNLELRSKMALADTFAGLCIANAGVTLPHGVGMAISGLYPHVMHGESLAIIYPSFSRFTYKYAITQFANVGRIFNPDLKKVPDEEAAEKACEEIDRFIKNIGMWMNLKDAKMPEEEIPLLAKASTVLPDYKANPRIATDEEMLELIKESYYR